MQQIAALDEFLALAWQLLAAAPDDRQSALRYPAVATIDEMEQPQLRTVVLRMVDPARRLLCCYTDRRSAKVGHLTVHPRMSWLFWDAERRVQIRAQGIFDIISRDNARQIWPTLSKEERRAYATELPPGTALPVADAGLPADWQTRTLAETEYAADHFMVLRTRLTELDLLHLHPDAHQRARYVWNALSDNWQGSWIVP